MISPGAKHSDDRTVSGHSNFFGMLSNRVVFQTVAFFLILAVYGCFALYHLAWADLDTDEGRYGLVGCNILSDYHQLAILSQEPLGSSGNQPFMHAMSLIPSLLVFHSAEFGLRLVSVLALLGAAILVYFTVESLGEKPISLLTLLFMLLNPWTITYAHVTAQEPVMTFWGCFAVFAAYRFSRSATFGWAALCGLTLGFCFLTKLWLCCPFALACVALVIARLLSDRSWQALTGGLAALLILVLTSVSHLLLVALWTPGALRHWLNIYFVYTLSSRVAGPGYDPVMWYRPWWFYLAGVFKAMFFGLPLLLFGLGTLSRRANVGVLAVVAAMLSPLLICSLARVKETIYVYPAFPAIAFLLAYGCVVAFRESPRKRLSVSVAMSIFIALLFLRCGVLTSRQAAAIAGLYLFYEVAILLVGRLRVVGFASIAFAASVTLLLTNALALRISLGRRTYYREIARYFSPTVASYRAQAVIFQAPEFPAMEFYLFRSGQYWQTYYFHESYEEFLDKLKKKVMVFYLVDPKGELYGGKISAPKLQALQQYADDDTARVEKAIGESIPWRIFVPQAN